MKIRIAFTVLALSLLLGGCGHFGSSTPPGDAQVSSNNFKTKALAPPADVIDEPDTLSDIAEEPAATAVDSKRLNPAGVSQIGINRKEQSMLDEALDFCDVAQAFWQKGELESALEALDKAYSLILEVDLDDAKLNQQKEDLRFLISKRILEIYASRNIVVNGNHHEIPMEMNRHVEAELQRFTGYEKTFFQEAYQRSEKYRPYILSALKNAGLPEELSWLPLIESGYKAKALSRARALGLWQFIPSTGYKFGLKRNHFVDERIDFIKSTDAAIAYLKELHAIFGDWMTVLAAYNCGEGRVLQVIRSQNVNYLDNFWDLYQRLPSETARYVPRFLATLHMVKNAAQYGLDQLPLETPLEFEEIEINRQVHLKDISAASGIDLEELKQLNPELRYQLLPPEPYRLKIPVQKEAIVLASLETVPVSQLPPQNLSRETFWHRVRPGETLSSIAKRYGMSLQDIMRANDLKRSNVLRVGQRLRVSRPEMITAAATGTGKPHAAGGGTHKVCRGDSLYNIAQRYSTTVEQIKSLNNLPSTRLVIGQMLRIPRSLPEPEPTVHKGAVYAVRTGDTPFTIAQKHNMELDRFLKINQLTVHSKIYPGQQVHID